MRGLLRELLASLVQIGAFARREISDVVRQPQLLLLLVVGPFAILAVFGAGVQNTDPPLAAVFVAPDADAAALVEPYLEDLESAGMDSAKVTTDVDEATAQLASGEADIVVVLPPNVSSTVAAGEQAEITVVHSFLDPLEVRAVELFTQTAVARANAALVSTAVTSLQSQAEEAEQQLSDAPDVEGLDEVRDTLQTLTSIPPDVLASPLSGDAQGVQEEVSIGAFYAPAVTALLSSHLVLVFAGMSLARERELGTIELYAVAPTSFFERLVGKLLGYLLIGGLIAAVLIAGSLALFGLGLGGLGAIAQELLVAVALLLVASCGLGLMIGSLAKESGAVVQVSLLTLLAAIFLSGLLISPERLAPFARGVGYLLPATHGIRLLRDLLLRGVTTHVTGLLWLGGIALVTLVVASILSSRRAVA